jgi:hypothetical protein
VVSSFVLPPTKKLLADIASSFLSFAEACGLLEPDVFDLVYSA